MLKGLEERVMKSVTQLMIAGRSPMPSSDTDSHGGDGSLASGAHKQEATSTSQGDNASAQSARLLAALGPMQ